MLLQRIKKFPFQTGPSQNTSNNWIFTVDRQKVAEGKGFILAVAVMFAGMYVLNLQYHTEAEATLEFLQRYTHIYKSCLSKILSLICWQLYFQGKLISVEITKPCIITTDSLIYWPNGLRKNAEHLQAETIYHTS